MWNTASKEQVLVLQNQKKLLGVAEIPETNKAFYYRKLSTLTSHIMSKPCGLDIM